MIPAQHNRRQHNRRHLDPEHLGSQGSTARDGWLLLRREGALWGVRRSALRQIGQAHGDDHLLFLANGGTLAVDEILGLAARLDPHPLPRCARPFLDAAIGNLAIWQQQPVALLDSAALDAGTPPPACFLPAPDRAPTGALLDTDLAEASFDGESH